MEIAAKNLVTVAVTQYSTRRPQSRHLAATASPREKLVGFRRLAIMSAALALIGLLVRSPLAAAGAPTAFLLITFLSQLGLVRAHRSLRLAPTFKLLPALRYARILSFILVIFCLLL